MKTKNYKTQYNKNECTIYCEPELSPLDIVPLAFSIVTSSQSTGEIGISFNLFPCVSGTFDYFQQVSIR